MAQLTDFVHRHPQIVSGALVFRETRVLVRNLHDYLACDGGLPEFLEQFPTVGRAQVEGYLKYSPAFLEDHFELEPVSV